MLIDSRATTAPGFGSSCAAALSVPLPRSRKNHTAPPMSTSTSGRTSISFFLDFFAPASPAAAPAAPAPAAAGVRVGVDIPRSWTGVDMRNSQVRELGGDLGDERADRRRLVAQQDDVDPPVERDRTVVAARVQGPGRPEARGRQPGRGQAVAVL